MSLQELIQTCDYMQAEDLTIIQDAHALATQYHQNQLRKSNAPYITHLEQVAIILASLKQQRTTIVASLLHDILEDTACEESVISDQFGTTVLALVKGVTKLARIDYPSNIDQQAENFRKLFMAMAKDIRVILIKLADRLHNMRTLHYLRIDKQRRIAKETIEIFAPLAHRLGMGNIKWELEDLSFSVLYRDEYTHIKTLVASKKKDREQVIDTMCTTVQSLLTNEGIHATVSGRVKHFYSIYKKLFEENIEFSQLFDLYGIRIIAKSIPDCYQILGYLHASYTPIEGRLKDYIALPKSNMYQSLHTTLLGPNGNRIEVQIRTHEMHLVAENGIASHWMYKEKHLPHKKDVDFSWLNQILNDNDQSPNHFLENLKLNLYDDEVFVFTPKGDILILPAGATLLDAAFKIHSNIGLRFKSGIVNGRIRPLQYLLQNGDQINIQTRTSNQPNLGWLDVVTTRFAKTTIKLFFRKQDAELRVTLGETKLKKILLKYGFISSKRDPLGQFLDRIQKKSNHKTHRDILLAIGHQELTDQFIIRSCKDDVSIPPPLLKTKKSKKMDRSLISVDGELDIETHIANCCQPLPGDPIVGFITRGYGVAIHHRHCKMLLKNKDLNRITPTQWIHQSQNVYETRLQLSVFDRPGLLKDLLDEISKLNINISKASTRLYKSGQAKIDLTCDISQMSEFDQLKNRLLQFEDVIDITRGH